jgi:riboflavin synthase
MPWLPVPLPEQTMFTGLVQRSGRVLRRLSAGNGVVFEIGSDVAIEQPVEGESIAINGVCLTAYEIGTTTFRVDVSPETLSRSTLNGLQVGGRVNVERALRLSDRLGGHLVSGHVDGLGVLGKTVRQGDFVVLNFNVPVELDRYIVEKGSIAVDGISLTVNDCGPGHFSVSIIPRTWQSTTLAELRISDQVNIEVDVIGKYIEKLLGHKADTPGARRGVDRELLAKSGYL